MADDPKQTLTFITRSAPYGSTRPQLCLDMALATAVFEQDVNYIFLGDGVYQLLKGQNGESIHAKTLGKALETLDLYGIENVFVTADTLESRNLSEEDLLLDVQVIDNKTLQQLLAKSHTVFNI